jgi:hypothetical protein
MTFYEELGVSETASREEIREALRHLARRDRERLYGTAEVLLDPERRKRYDRSLMALAAVLEQPASIGPAVSVWRTLAPAAIAVAGALLILVAGSSSVRAPLSSGVAVHSSPAIPAVPTLDSEQDWEPLSYPVSESHLAAP